MTTPKELKALAEALEINVESVPDKNVAVLNAIAENYEGNGDAETIPEALQNITAVAGNIGSKPEGTISITANGTDIDVAQYAKADVNVSGASVGITLQLALNSTGGSSNYLDLLNNHILDADYRIGEKVGSSWNKSRTIYSVASGHDTNDVSFPMAHRNAGPGQTAADYAYGWLVLASVYGASASTLAVNSGGTNCTANIRTTFTVGTTNYWLIEVSGLSGTSVVSSPKLTLDYS